MATEIALVKVEHATAIADTQETMLAEIERIQKSEIPAATATTSPADACKDVRTYSKIYRKYEPAQNAEILSIPAPELTPDAIEHKDEAVGQMTLDLILAPCGVMDHIVMRGSVPYGLTEMAIKAAKKIEFNPAINDGNPVPQMVSVRYEFYTCPESVICTKGTEDVR